jgi:hypothetical protein
VPTWVSETVEGAELRAPCVAGVDGDRLGAHLRLPSELAVFVAEVCTEDVCSGANWVRSGRDLVVWCDDADQAARVTWLQLGPDRDDGSTPWTPAR